MSNYDELLSELRKYSESAHAYIPKMCEALRDEDKHISNEDIRDKVTKDCLEAGLSKSTILHYLPEELKDAKKVEAGKKGAAKKKEMEMLTDGSVLQDSAAGLSPVGQKEPDLGSSGSEKQEQDKEPWKPKGEDDVEFLKKKLNETLEYNSKLEAINKNLTQIKPETDEHDCSNHSMYLKAQAVIETERKEKEEYKNRVDELDKIVFVNAAEAPNPPDMFQVPKDIITGGAYHKKLSPIQAISQIRQLLNAVTYMEIGWRVIE